MSDHCCGPAACTTDTNPAFRRVLWWALAINVVMFGVEIVAGWLAAGAVYLSGTRWPDLLVAAVIAGLALTGAWRVVRSAARELRVGGLAGTVRLLPPSAGLRLHPAGTGDLASCLCYCAAASLLGDLLLARGCGQPLGLRLACGAPDSLRESVFW
jgi:hypothetical protein